MADHTDISSERRECNRTVRLASSRPKLADIPALFAQITADPRTYSHSIAIPRSSSERRAYIPIAFLDNSVVATDLLQIIPDATIYHFGILTSQMHMAWIRAVAGHLKSDYRYSKDIVYNNFIRPEVTDAQKAEIETLAQAVLDARAEFPDSSLADLYDPFTTPPSLVKAHRTLDRAVDRLYNKSGFPDDPARVAHLFKLYKENVSA